MDDFKVLRCPDCGANKIEKQGEEYYCPHCTSRFTDDIAAKEYEKLSLSIKEQIGDAIDESLRREKEERFYNLRTNLWEKVHAKYTDSQAIVTICRDIKGIVPNDFVANFYEIANTATSGDIIDFINKIDVEEQELYVDRVFDFMLRQLSGEYTAPLNYLIERAYRDKDLKKYEEYITALEKETEKVDSGIYETMIHRDVFIAYSSKDIDEVMELMQLLEENGISCFVALRNLRHGRDAVANYDSALNSAIDNCSMVVFVSSKNSRNFSCDALKKELKYIKEKEMANAPSEYSNRNYADIPWEYKKLRIEYRLDNRKTAGADLFLKEFFAELDYCESAEKVLARVVEFLTGKHNLFSKKELTKHTAVAEKSEAKASVPKASVTIDSLLKRAYLCLEDQDFAKADSIVENIMNIDPECAEAYLVKLLIEKKFVSKEKLKSVDFDLNEHPIFMRALRFATPEYKQVLNDYRSEAIYKRANSCYASSNTVEKYNTASRLYEKIIDYRDSRSKKAACAQGILEIHYQEALKTLNQAKNFKDPDKADAAMKIFMSIENYKDSSKLISECPKVKKDIIYANGIDFQNRANQASSIDDVEKLYTAAIKEFSKIGGWLDSKEKRAECEKLRFDKMHSIALERKDAAQKYDSSSLYSEAVQLLTRVSRYAPSADVQSSIRSMSDECLQKENSAKKNELYNRAISLMEQGTLNSMKSAYEIFTGLDDWKKSASYRDKINKIINKDKRSKEITSELSGLTSTIERNETIIQNVEKLKKKKKRLRFLSLLGLITVCIALYIAISNGIITDGNVAENTPGWIMTAIMLVVSFFISIGTGIYYLIGKVEAKYIIALFIPGINGFAFMAIWISSVIALFQPLTKAEKKTLTNAKKIAEETKRLLKTQKSLNKELNSL